MKTKEVKLMIIDNFIDHYTTREDERMEMREDANTYVEEDHVDEIVQAGYIKPTLELCREIEEKVLKVWHARAKAQGYKPHSKKAKDLQAEFLFGMVAACDVIMKADQTDQSSISPRVLFSVMRGNYIE